MQSVGRGFWSLSLRSTLPGWLCGIPNLGWWLGLKAVRGVDYAADTVLLIDEVQHDGLETGEVSILSHYLDHLCERFDALSDFRKLFVVLSQIEI
jgi:hypothetical protein